MLKIGIFPAMGNKLKELRTAAGMTHEQAAEAMGVSRSQFIKLERGERRLTVDYINQAAKGFGVRPSDVIDEEMPSGIPLMGFIGAGAEIEPEFEQVPPEGLDQVTFEIPLPDGLIAFQIRGDSMLPFYKDGHIVVVWEQQKRPIEAFYGEEAVVRTSSGRRFLKTIERGIAGINLRSFNAPVIENQKIEWIGEIFAVMPRLQWKGIEKKGGIQGRLRLGANA
jgi:repressor LexA